MTRHFPQRAVQPQSQDRQRRCRPASGLLVSALQDPKWTANAERIYAGYYTTVGYVHKDLGDLKAYERHTRLTGALIVLVLLLALAAPALAADRRARLAGGLFAICGFALLIGPVLTNFYDWRYSIPAHGPLAAAAASGLSGLAARRRALRSTSS